MREQGREGGIAPRRLAGVLLCFWLASLPRALGAVDAAEVRSFPEGGRWVYLHASPAVVGYQDPSLAKSEEEGERDISCLLVLPSAAEGLRPREALDRLLQDIFLFYYNEMVGARAPYFRRQKLSFFLIRPGSRPDGAGRFAASQVTGAGTVGLAEMAAAVFPRAIARRQVRIIWGRAEGEVSGLAEAWEPALGGSEQEEGGPRRTLRALDEAIAAHSRESLEKILASAPSYPIDYGDPESALVEATRRDPGLAQLLVERYGADPTRQASALIAALPAGADEPAILSLLQSFLKRGLGINAATDTGQTLLHRAVALHYPAVLAFLLVQGANPNAQDQQDRTPLMLAVEQRDPEAVKLLLAHGADAHRVRNNRGVTAAEMARALQDPGLVRLLEESP
ncbi:protein of unknown function [Methylacidimicrobium sp. AP8]|uniref:ankyrin repeat domain-containing protein n=1 Tax=Methylacidimicrobium sp. AP8 TaxID=2730359 RepID=UPI0018C1AFEA|nr:ankyrin repeat domain-containing protein [Methylacidimicrobium sp. AP8]CAB4242837.1 protein of unknown function [Methylacidimicrobium sp. AP8]